jgi:ribulose-phosphate 3-epimerase
MIHQAGKKAGVAINPATPYAVLESILPDADLVLVMTVNPGWGGQSLIPSQMEKIRALRMMISQLKKDIRLEVDGGINPQTARQVAAAGADVLVAGSAVFHHGNRAEADYRQVIDELRKAGLPPGTVKC